MSDASRHIVNRHDYGRSPGLDVSAEHRFGVGHRDDDGLVFGAWPSYENLRRAEDSARMYIRDRVDAVVVEFPAEAPCQSRRMEIA